MRTFQKGDNTWKTNDAIIIRALLNDGYIEIAEEIQEVKAEVEKPKKRSKIVED